MIKYQFLLVSILFISIYHSSALLSKENTNNGLEKWIENMKIEMKPVQMEFTEFNFTMNEIICSRLQLHNIESNHSFVERRELLELKMEGIGIFCSAKWKLIPSWFSSHYLEGNSSFELNSSSFSQLELAFDRNEHGMVNNTQLLSCNNRFQISKLNFEGGFLGRFLQWIRKPLEFTLREGAEIILCAEINKVMERNVSSLLHSLQLQMEPFLSPNIPTNPPLLPSPSLLLNLSDSSVMGFINSLVDDRFASFSFHSLLSYFHLDPTLFSFSNISRWLPPIAFSLSNSSRVEVEWRECSISGLDSFSFDLLEPFSLLKSKNVSFVYPFCNLTEMECKSAEETLLISTINIPSFRFHSTFFLNFTLENGNSLTENISLSFNLSNIQFQSNSIVALNAKEIEKLSLNQFLSEQNILSVIELVHFSFLKLNISIEDIQLSGNQRKLERGIEDLVNNFISIGRGPFLSSLLDHFVGTSLRSSINSFFSQLKRSGIEENQNFVPNGYQDKDFNWFWTVIAFGSACFLFFSLLIITIGVSNRNRNPSLIVDESSFLLLDFDSVEKQKKWETSIVLNSDIHWTIRFGIPLLILMNVAMFISAHTSIGANFHVLMTVGEKEYLFPSSYKYTTWNNVFNMWNAKIYYLSIIIAVIIGILPYLKSLLLLLYWISPHPTFLSPIIVSVFDHIGKWLFTDIIVLTFLANVLHFKIEPPPSPRFPNGAIKLEAFLIPEWGSYCFLLATILSLFVSHLILYHSKFYQKRSPSISRISLREVGNNLLSFLLPSLIVLSIALLGVGSFMPSFGFKTKGLFGLFQDEIGGETFEMVTLARFIADLPSNSINPKSVPVILLQTLFCTFTIFPILISIIFLGLYFTRLSVKWQRRIHYVGEIACSWSGVEMIALALTICVFAVGPFADFLVSDFCDPFQPLLNQYLGGSKCYQIEAAFDKKSSLLISGAFIWFSLTKILPIVTHKLITKRDFQN